MLEDCVEVKIKFGKIAIIRDIINRSEFENLKKNSNECML